jgi:hypothetical protein
MSLFVTLHAKNAKMSRKWRRQAPIGETLALSGQNQHPVSQTLAPLGLLQPAMCAQKAQHTAIYSRERPTSPGWRPIHLGQRPICKGLIPMGQISAKTS